MNEEEVRVENTTYQQNAAYQQPYYYGGTVVPEKGDGTAFGIASMVLGIVALLLFCTGCNVLLAILAIVFGIIQILKNNQKGFAIAGIVTGAVSIVAFVVFIIALLNMEGTSYYLYNYADQYYNDGSYDDGDSDLYDDNRDGLGNEL